MIIGQSYTGTNHLLYGPVNDARAMAFCLRRLETRPYAVTQRTNLTSSEVFEAIADSFAEARQDDISLLFFSGHGEEGGELLGSDLSAITPSQLRSALDQIPGRKIVIVDACYSGALLQERAAREQTPVQKSALSDFTQAFAAPFQLKQRSTFDGADQYYLLTSAHANETSEEALIASGGSSRVMGYFTYSLCLGCGWDGVANTPTDLLADENGDLAVTLVEACAYARNLAQTYNEHQTALAYPQDCTAFAPFRK